MTKIESTTGEIPVDTGEPVDIPIGALSVPTPKITEITVQGKMTGGTVTPATTFTTSDYVYITYSIDNPGQNISETHQTLFRNGTEVRKYTPNTTSNNAGYINSLNKATTVSGGNYTIQPSAINAAGGAGTYRFEVYVVDSNGNKSNTATVSFTVN
jgi:hypothetical protein